MSHSGRGEYIAVKRRLEANREVGKRPPATTKNLALHMQNELHLHCAEVRGEQWKFTCGCYLHRNYFWICTNHRVPHYAGVFNTLLHNSFNTTCYFCDRIEYADNFTFCDNCDRLIFMCKECLRLDTETVGVACTQTCAVTMAIEAKFDHVVVPTDTVETI